jgi:SAM-dependent methyltransferase
MNADNAIPDQNEAKLRSGLDRGNDEFWSRFGGAPDFAGKTVLEIGCGLGALCIDMAGRGAQHVTGVDIRPEDTDFAAAYVAERLPHLSSRLTFSCAPISDLGHQKFDFVVSKDSFEHIIDYRSMLASIRKHLADDGKLYVGFSPLYHSPYGDHDRRQTAFSDWGLFGKLLATLPWGHLLLERLVLKRHRLIQARPIESMHDLNLNMVSISEFRHALIEAGFKIKQFDVNRGDNKIGKLFSILRRLPGLEKYMSYNVYTILENAE